ncbi:helix-turn-helix transcriptional regulator [Nonomuraea endophytica]|uniref:DNA-binding CsgD family transcriptional regulator n=1 Tax=Nonomuraea endophytica TaxID=714136 RepID=A0A7W8A908_9ACTN|nr:helix-turn-helix transcriptional regulator [Nonomuraea endophytica]MBB5081839.1 DNA-binding CsgD family transcriptional regulator [Nonomuraea endophytica]
MNVMDSRVAVGRTAARRLSRYSSGDYDAPARLLRRIFDEVCLDEKTSARVAHLIDEWFDTRRAAVDSRSVKMLLWRGRVDEAVSVIAEGPGSWLDSAAWIRFWYPDLGVPPSGGQVEVVTGLEGLDVLNALLGEHDERAAVRHAQQVLRHCPMGEGALESLTSALITLVYAGRADLAARWCVPLLEQTTTHCDPAWLGVFAAIQAEIHVRQGDPAQAERCAHAALTHLSLREWGVALSFPLASMVSAKLALDKPEEAARYLAVPVPEATFQTPAGLHYRYARGEYALATGAPRAALDDFAACGDAMARWGLDLPGIVPWRLGAARSYVDLGRPERACELVADHLALLPPGPSKGRGAALTLRAAASPVQARQALLEEAVEIFQVVRDQAGLAGALKALASVNSQLGQAHRARLFERRALTIERPGLDAEPGARELLSDAERRVATLAAQGYTNRRIAEKLYVSVSTVEQHLTHIYRKLGISRRLDLPARLD